MQENCFQIRTFNELYIKYYHFQFQFTFILFNTIGGRNVEQQQMAIQIHNFQIFIQTRNQPFNQLINFCNQLLSVALNSFPNVEYEHEHLFEMNRYFLSPICFWFLPKRLLTLLKCDNLGPMTVSVMTHTLSLTNH